MDIWKDFIYIISAGGEVAVITVLLLVIAFLLYDRRSLLKISKELTDKISITHDKVVEAKEKEVQSIKEIVEKYHNGTLSTIQALNELKIVLISIKESVR